MEYLLVDGYNVIHAWNDVFDVSGSLEDNRALLLQLLSDYQGYTGFRVVVVFDAYLVPDGLGSLDTFDNITVVFTKKNQTADTFIQQFVNNNRFKDNITVVTDDYMEQKTVFQKGALRMTANELKQQVFEKKRKATKDKTLKDKANYLYENLDKTEKQKLQKIRYGKNDESK